MNTLLRTYRFITALLILSIISLGISPACDFMSGAQASDSSTSFIEICTHNGIERIAVADGFGAHENISDTGELAQTGEIPPAPQISEQCEFCFAASHFEVDLPSHIDVTVLRFTPQTHFAFQSRVYKAQHDLRPQTRAPPVFS